MEQKSQKWVSVPKESQFHSPELTSANMFLWLDLANRPEPHCWSLDTEKLVSFRTDRGTEVMTEKLHKSILIFNLTSVLLTNFVHMRRCFCISSRCWTSSCNKRYYVCSQRVHIIPAELQWKWRRPGHTLKFWATFHIHTILWFCFPWGRLSTKTSK